MAFLEIEFPRKLALQAVGGPGYFTTINPGFSGYEQRNQNWQNARAQYAVSFEHRTVPEWQALESLYHAARGMANGWRLFDPGDYSALGQFIAEGDGVTTQFQLQLTYAFPISQYEQIRLIQKPITSKVITYQGNSLPDTVNVYLNGSPQTHNVGYVTGGGVQFTLDETTGIITFTTAPGDDVIITADFQYHIPVRFDLQSTNSQTVSTTEGPLQKTYETSPNAPGGVLVSISGLTLVEIRIQPGESVG